MLRIRRLPLCLALLSLSLALFILLVAKSLKVREGENYLLWLGRLHGLMFLSSVNHFPEDLWHQLKRLGLKNDNDEKHPALGNNKQALELLVQQRLVWYVLWNL